VARIGALSNGSNGQRSLESASLHFKRPRQRESGIAEREPSGELLSERGESKVPRTGAAFVGHVIANIFLRNR